MSLHQCCGLFLLVLLSAGLVSPTEGSAFQADPVATVAERLGSDDPATRLAAIEQLRALAAKYGDQAAQALAKAAGDDKADVASAALAALGSLGSQGAPAVETLAELLARDDANLQIQVLDCLGRIGPAASAAVPAIKDRLGDDSPEVLAHAVWALAVVQSRVSPELQDALPKLMAALQSDSPQVRNAGVRALAVVGRPSTSIVRRLLTSDNPTLVRAGLDIATELGPQADEAVDELRRIVADRQADVEVVAGAASALGAIGPAASAAIEPLAARLTSDDSAVRAYAASALGKIASDSALAERALLARADDPDPIVRREVLSALSRVVTQANRERVSAVLLAVLADEQPAIQLAALDGLSRLGLPNAEALARLLANPQSAHMAAILLGELGEEAAEAVNPLRRVLTGDLTPEVKMQVLLALGGIGPKAAAAVPDIQAALEHGSPAVRYAAAYALGAIGPAASGSAEALTKLSQGDEAYERLVAVWALAQIAPDDRTRVNQALEALTAALVGEDPQLRMLAAQGLVELEVPPRAKLAALQKAIAGAEGLQVRRAMQVMGELVQPAVPLLIEQLENPETASVAALALGQAGPEAAAAVPGLVKMLSRADRDARFAALVALGQIGPKSAAAVPAVQTVLESDEADTELRMVAAWTLGSIGLAAKPAATALKQLVQGDDAQLRDMAAWALVHIRPEGENLAAYLPLLVEGTRDQRPLVRRQMALALGELGLTDPSAIDALNRLMQDHVPEVSAAATMALEQIKERGN